MLSFYCLFDLFFKTGFLLYNSTGCPGTLRTDQAGTELVDLPASTTCTTMPSIYLISYINAVQQNFIQ